MTGEESQDTSITDPGGGQGLAVRWAINDPMGSTQQGVYSNIVRVTYTPTEVVLDFCLAHVGSAGDTRTANVGSRVILAPATAARLLLTLRDALANRRAQLAEEDS